MSRYEYGVPAPLPDHIQHGQPAAYNKYRCRCDTCVRYRTQYDQRRAAQASEPVPLRPSIIHGSTIAVTEFGCRCTTCAITAAWLDAGGRRTTPGPRGEPIPLPALTQHGSIRAYQYYRCRCDDCRNHRNAYNREYEKTRILRAGYQKRSST